MNNSMMNTAPGPKARHGALADNLGSLRIFMLPRLVVFLVHFFLMVVEAFRYFTSSIICDFEGFDFEISFCIREKLGIC